MRVLFAFGTRPEAIKMAPVVLAMRADGRFEPIVCLTGQHREMLDAALAIFHIEPDMNLALMRPDQTVNQVISGVFDKLDPILFDVKPDYVLVQGDTATSMAAAVTAFMRGIRVGHVEAGLRNRHPFEPLARGGQPAPHRRRHLEAFCTHPARRRCSDQGGSSASVDRRDGQYGHRCPRDRAPPGSRGWTFAPQAGARVLLAWCQS